MIREGRCTGGQGRGQGCGAKVLWLTTDRGRYMPVDDTEKVRSAIARNPGASYEALAFILTSDLSPHWATCPHADTHRKPR